MRLHWIALGMALAGCAMAPRVDPPRLVTRQEWGSKPQPIPDSRRQTPKWITIHHAGEIWKSGADPAEFVREMQVMGQNRPQTQKPPRNTFWPDVPYHYLIAPDGRVFEGRPVEYEPDSNTNYSLNGNIGVELMGNFDEQRPSPQQLRAVVQLTAWLMRRHHIAWRFVRTHRDAAPQQTECPGMDFYRYIEDGSLHRWVDEALAGREPQIDPGPPITDTFRHVVNGIYDYWVRVKPGEPPPAPGPEVKNGGPTEPIPVDAAR